MLHYLLDNCTLTIFLVIITYNCTSSLKYTNGLLTYNIYDDAFSNATYLVENLRLFHNGGGLHCSKDSYQLTLIPTQKKYRKILGQEII